MREKTPTIYKLDVRTEPMALLSKRNTTKLIEIIIVYFPTTQKVF